MMSQDPEMGSSVMPGRSLSSQSEGELGSGGAAVSRLGCKKQPLSGVWYKLSSLHALCSEHPPLLLELVMRVRLILLNLSWRRRRGMPLHTELLVEGVSGEGRFSAFPSACAIKLELACGGPSTRSISRELVSPNPDPERNPLSGVNLLASGISKC
jgi:hypothetical protein